MFKKVLKVIGIVLAGLVGLAAVLVIALYALGNARLTRKYDVQAGAIAIPTDAAALEQGRHWAVAYCAGCHGADFSGKPLVDDASIGYIAASNLTGGGGGAGGEFSDADWVRALRNGVNPEGRALIAMPSQNYYYMSDQDLGALIGYLKTVPPVDHEMDDPALSFMGKVVLATGAFGKEILPAEVIDHAGPRPAVIEPGVNAKYGGYLVRLGGCRDCHGSELTGGKSPEPEAPYAPDITAKGAMRTWSQETFINVVYTARENDMPWGELRAFTDPELEAVYTYLRSLPAK